MPSKTPPGSYRHAPADEIRVETDGQRYHSHARRRMPFAAQVFVAYACLGPLLAWVTALVLKQFDHGRLLPDVVGTTKLPPCPSPQNVLFGASWVDLVLGCGLTGWCVWLMLWKTPVSVEAVAAGSRALIPKLVRQGITYSIAALPVVAFLATFSLYMRTAPPEQPWLVRPFFALLANIPMQVTALVNGVIPLVMLVQAVIVGVISGVVAALIFPHCPEESIMR